MKRMRVSSWTRLTVAIGRRKTRRFHSAQRAAWLRSAQVCGGVLHALAGFASIRALAVGLSLTRIMVLAHWVT
ncbi:hypothetical protein CWO89_30345 [Bradyrhizobium sp. Leo170]|nr:hypothetical protein CWO90_47230 [Bradyrhizobium sp. Leo121]TAI62330.1 hypothetical protein CWO89_30345 [Bradyrhizobium sp. Leo170]